MCLQDSVAGDGDHDVPNNVKSAYDPSCRFTYIQHYLQHGKHHPDVPGKHQSGIRKAKSNFVVRGR
jgi:hypothetical protein